MSSAISKIDEFNKNSSTDCPDCLVMIMKKTSYLTLFSLLFCISAPVQAAIGRSPVIACRTEIPLIPLEKSLIPFDKSASAAVPSSTGSYASTHAAANALIRGLLVANRTGEIGFSNVLSYRVQDVVRNLRRGKSLAFASDRSNVPDRVLGRLLQLGGRGLTSSIN